jgi:hypothetical protein
MARSRHARPVSLALALSLIAAVSVVQTPSTSAAAAASGAAPSGQQAFVRTLALTGQPAPGGGTFTEFSDPALNNRGDLAFGALTTDPRAHTALYMLAGGRLTTLVAAGEKAPTGGAFRAFNDVQINDRGTVVFLGRTTDQSAPEGLYMARAGRVVPLVAAGQTAPSGGVFTDFANPTINSHDVVAFVGRIGSGEGIFTSTEGSTIPAVLAGQAAPTGGEFQFFLDGTPAQNDRGQIAFVASTTLRSTQGIYVLSGGRVIPVATTEDTAPVGGVFTEFGFVTLTDGGTVGFVGRTAHSGIREALYATGRAALVTLAQQGEAVPRGVLTTFINAAMNAAEEMVFQPGTPDPLPHAIYVATRRGVRTISRAGDAAPGGGHFTAFSTPALNNRGQIAFVAETNDGRHGVYLVNFR